MSLTVKSVSSSTSWLDVRWSSTSSTSQQSCYLVSVASSDSAAGAKREWAVMVRDSKTSAIRFDLEQSGIVGTPLVTVRRCCVTRSVLGEEHWRVDQVGNSLTTNSTEGDDPMESPSSCSPSRPTSPLGLFIYFIIFNE